MVAEYGRLELRQEIPTASGGTAKEIIISRPTAKVLLQILDVPASKPTEQLATFARGCCRAVNGVGEPSEFKIDDLEASDAAELASAATSLGQDVVGFELPPEAGDGIGTPLFYELRKPVTLTRGEEPIVISQIQFEARRMREITEFLDARAGSAEEFSAFLRCFGQLVGHNLPINEVFINELDYMDYLIIRGPLIMGKLVRSRGRWRKTAT